MGADPSRHRRRAAARADPRADRARACTTASSSSATPTPASWSNARRRRATTSACSSMRRRDARSRQPAMYPHNKLWWDRLQRSRRCRRTPRAPTPACFGSFTLPDGAPVKPAFELLDERVRDCTPEWAAEITGIPAATIRRLAHEMGVTARDQKIELPIAWTDSWGVEHETRDRQSGGVPRDARARRAFERLPDDSRARDPDEPARHDRPAGRLPSQGAVPARRSRRSREAAEQPERGEAQHAARRACRSAGRRDPTTSSSTTTASRCASTRASRGSTRCRCTA